MILNTSNNSELFEKPVSSYESWGHPVYIYICIYSPEKDQRSGAIGRVKVGCRSGAYVLLTVTFYFLFFLFSVYWLQKSLIFC